MEPTLTIANTGNSETSSEGSKKFQYLESRFECPICLTCLKLPFITACGHKFCKDCIHQWLKREGGTCPIDSQKLNLETDIFPDNYTKREIAHHIVTCPFPECSKALPLLEAEKHMFITHENEEICVSDKFSCPFAKIGCKYELPTQSQTLNHIQTFMSHHLLLLMNAHDKLLSYIQGASLDGEAALWDPDKNGVSTSALLKTLYEKIITLEQANQEKEIEIKSVKSLIGSVKDQVQTEIGRCSNGVLLWKLTNVTRTLRNMVTDTSIKLFSEGFYTSFYGYKFCCRLNANPCDTNYLSLNVHLMKGLCDYSLIWPFCGRISVSLVHPTCCESSLRDVMVSNPSVDAFKRPRTDIALRGFGYVDFVSFSQLFDDGFINVDDSLTIRVEIVTV